MKNYLVTSKYAKNTEGHIDAKALEDAIKNHNGSEAYYNVFDVDEGALTLDEGKKSFKGINGMVRPAFNLVQFDFDDEASPINSYNDMKKFTQWLGNVKSFVAYSGAKGFHVGVPFGYFGIKPSEALPKQLKLIAQELKNHFPTLDTSVYNANRKFRALNSKHPKTNLYKTLINPLWPYQRIVDTAKKRSNKLYNMNGDTYEPVPQLTELINRVATQVQYDKEKVGTREAPTAYERFAGKKCIEKLLSVAAPKGEINNTGLVIINDLFKTGKTKEEALSIFSKWLDVNGIDETDRVMQSFDEVFNGTKYYNHGCQEPIKSKNCDPDCKIWRSVHPDKRPKENMQPKHEKQLEVDTDKRNKPKEMDIVRGLLCNTFACEYLEASGTFQGGNLLKQDKDLFYYKEGYWRRCETREVDFIKQRVALAYGNKVQSSQIDSAFKSFMIFTPSKPERVDMFSPNPNCANFKNGTLTLTQAEAGGFDLQFREHRKDDYLTNKINLDYTTEARETNILFEEVLDRTFDGAPDKMERINCIQEMFGASLIPAFPHLFFLHGQPNTGKSVLGQVLMELIGEDNLSSVQPHEFEGFNMSSMINKLVNIVTDIDTISTIKDSIVKQIEDRVKITVRRKNLPDIKAMLPAVHVFGANNLPKTFDGGNKAHNRRWTIINFDNVYDGRPTRFFHKVIYNKNPQGVVDFAIKGLHRLIKQRGFFSDNASGLKQKESWQLENDPVGLFIKDIEDGEVVAPSGGMPLKLKEEGKLKRSDLWNCFHEWKQSSGRRNSKIYKQTFFKLMQSKGFQLMKYEGNFCFKGIE